MPLIFYLSKKTRPINEFIVRGLSQKKKTKLNPKLLREKKEGKKKGKGKREKRAREDTKKDFTQKHQQKRET